MCLTYVAVPRDKEGIGYKIVRKTKEEGVFLPFYSSFGPEGGDLREKKDGFRATRIKYRLDKVTTTKVKGRVCVSDFTKRLVRYEAGIHLYKSVYIAYRHSYIPEIITEPVCIIKCSYTRAYAEDKDVVVCKSIKPLEIVKEVK